MKTYKLIIQYDDHTDEIEYIEESITEDSPNEYERNVLVAGDVEDMPELLKYFDGVIGES